MTSEKKASDFIKNVMGFQKRSKTLHAKLQLLLDEHAKEQRQMCHDKIIDEIEDFARDSNLAPWYECADICLNATGEEFADEVQELANRAGEDSPWCKDPD